MKEKLLDAAEAEFAARGFEGARLEDIAAACGMRRASLLYHFESKQALYENVLERAFGDLGRMMASAIARPAASYADRLDDVIGRLIDDFVRRPLFARLILRDTLDQDGVSAERGRRFVAPLLELGDAFIRGG
ncbi:MAG: TetR/AcrR family transcriptional regulator, partial [Polyangiales bacterium]